MDNVSDMTNFHSRLFVHAGKAFASRSMRLPITDLPSDLPSVSPFECVWSSIPPSASAYTWPSSSLLFQCLVCVHIHTGTFAHVCGDQRWMEGTFPITPYRVEWDTEPEAHNKTKWYNQWSQDPDSPTSSLPLPLLPQHWGYNVCPAFTWLLRIRTQSGPYVSTAGALRAAISWVWNPLLYGICLLMWYQNRTQGHVQDRQGSTTVLPVQPGHCLTPCLLSGCPPTVGAKKKQKKLIKRFMPETEDSTISVSVLSERWFKTSNLHQWKYPQTYKIKQEFTYYIEHTLLIRTLEISS